MAPNRLQENQQQMGDAIYEFQLHDSIYRLNTHAQLKVVARKAEPKPKVLRQVNEAIFKELPDKRKGPQLPKEYIQYSGKEAETDEDEVEYDIDDEDIVWLELINERRKKEKLKPITEKLLELGIDRFEKASYFQNPDSARAPTVDNDAACCICFDGEDSNVNQIIFCDMCNIAVHQECYGVPYIPAGQWLCRRCQLSPSEPVKCVFCPYAGGAFKQTSDNHWAHVVCALWLSEVHFGNAVFLEPVEGVAFSLKRRCKLTCGVCRIKQGACLQCSKKSCVRAVHVTCAIFSEMHMKTETQDKDGETIVNRFAFCHQHSALLTKTMPPTIAAFKRQSQEKVKKAKRIMQSASNQSSHHIAVPVISTKKLDEIREELKIDKVEDLLAYWSLKRRSRCGVPLIRRLQVYTTRKQLGRRSNEGLLDGRGSVSPIGDTAPQMSGVQKEFANQLYRIGKLRNNLEKLRLLIELTKKREKYKLEMIENYKQIIENTMKPPHEILENVLNKLIEKDHQNVFLKGVTEEEVPGYHKIIKKPMSFEKMRSKLQNGDYKHAADLQVDFVLMMDNCALFNKDNIYFWRYGHQMRSIGLKILKTAEQDEQVASSGKLMADVIPLIFEEDEIDSELKEFMNHCIADEKQESKKRKISNASSRKRSIAETNNGLKDTKIIDYFKPAASPPSPKRSRKQDESEQKPPRQSGSSSRRPTQRSRSNRQTKQKPENNNEEEEREEDQVIKEEDLELDTEKSSEEDEDYKSRSKRQKRRKSSSSRSRKSRSKKETEASSSKQLKSPKSEPQHNPELYSHDDLVWAPLSKAETRMPARVFDRVHILFEEDQTVVDKIQRLPIHNSNQQILLVFFDTDQTVKYVPIADLDHCDPNQRLSRSGSSTVITAHKRAKEYWKKQCDL